MGIYAKFEPNYFLSMHSIHRILIFLIGFVLFSSTAIAQRQQDKEMADLYLQQAQLILSETRAVDDALELMITAANADSANIEANFQAGHLHLLTTHKERASKYFLRIFRQNPNFRFDLPYWIGKSYQYGLSFDKAIEFYTIYDKKLKNNPSYDGQDKIAAEEVTRRIFECNNGKDFVANPKNYSIVNLGNEINSEFEDYAPVFNENEDEIVFTSRRKEGNLNENVFEDNKPYEDIFYSKKVGGKWRKAENIGTRINTPFHDSNLSLSPDGKTLFIYKDENGGDVYFCLRQQDGSWSVPQPLAGEVNSNYRETSVSISRDGSTLYFASDRPGGLGGSDIYMSKKNAQGEWTQVKNLGARVNTDQDDESPFIDYDGKTIYFSSMGHKGMGGFDIYKSTLLDAAKNQWSEPENLGYPVNSPDNDIFYVVSKDGQRAYYSSTRDDGMGYSDIYLITTPKAAAPEPTLQPLQYSVAVVDGDTQKPIAAKVKLQRVKDNLLVGSRTEGTGLYLFSLRDKGTGEYNLSVEMEGYIFQNLLVTLEGASADASVVNKTVAMRKLVVGATSILRNIYFDFGKATFKQESYSELNKLENMMRQNDRIRVEIAGHTDNVSSAAFNKRLSLLRANAVKDFLTSKGVDTRRVTTVGYGEERPLASNDDEKEGREINRRVEFKVLGN